MNMNWDATKHELDKEFFSEPLTVTGIKGIKVEGGEENWDCYLIEVEENITYWDKDFLLFGKSSGDEKVTKKEIYTYRKTFENRKHKGDDQKNPFYYFVHKFGKGAQVKIPFKGGFIQ